MTFPEAIRAVLRRYADFTGRARRPEFWWWILLVALVNAGIETLEPVRIGESTLAEIVGGAWAVAVLLPTLAVAVRRLRDTGRRWTTLFYGLIPVAGLIILAVQLSQPAVDDPLVSTRPQDAR